MSFGEATISKILHILKDLQGPEDLEDLEHLQDLEDLQNEDLQVFLRTGHLGQASEGGSNASTRQGPASTPP